MKTQWNFFIHAYAAVLLSIATTATAQGNTDATGQAALLSGDGQRIGFTGYRKDEATGLYYAGARWYDPLVGGFNAMDPAMGSPDNPITFNRYLYANANPTRYVDPTGRYAEAGHYYTTYYVALRTGFSNADAQKLAFYSQLPDEADRLDAMSVQSDALGAEMIANLARAEGAFVPELVHTRRDNIQQNMHSLTGGIASVETRKAIEAIRQASGDLATTGILIHRLGDSFAHRDPNSGGRTYKTGFGHGRAGHRPDIIQRDPELYLHYVETLARTLAARNVTNDEAVAAMAMHVRRELEDVANIETVVRPNIKVPEWNPTGWMQSPPTEVTTAMRKIQRGTYARSNKELESMSIAMLRKKLYQSAGSMAYQPELLPSGDDKFAKFVPGIWEAKTIRDAVQDFQSGASLITSHDEALLAVDRALLLMQQQTARNPGQACIVSESGSGEKACRQ